MLLLTKRWWSSQFPPSWTCKWAYCRPLWKTGQRVSWHGPHNGHNEHCCQCVQHRQQVHRELELHLLLWASQGLWRKLYWFSWRAFQKMTDMWLFLKRWLEPLVHQKAEMSRGKEEENKDECPGFSKFIKAHPGFSRHWCLLTTVFASDGFRGLCSKVDVQGFPQWWSICWNWKQE